MIGQRLPFVLADWTRLIWVSEVAKAVWQQRIHNINEAWSRIERWAVVEGARHSCLTFFEPHYLPEATHWATSHGLVLLPMARVGIADQYSATPKAVEDGSRWQYRAVLTRHEFAQEWLAAWRDTGEGGRYKGTNNRAIGGLLGYPECCIDFFEREWVEQSSVDTTWAMAQGTASAVAKGSTIAVSGPPEANILLRWLGVRLVAHLPCSFACEGTVRMASAMAEVGRQRQFGEWVDWIYQMLEWPVEWSALHGIAEVRTPVVTISTRTNATADKIVVQRAGSVYPEEGANGLHFPYRIVTGRVTSKPAFKRSLLPIHELNGFGSEASMNVAHDAVLSALPSVHRGVTETFLDLGCGSGKLLERAEEKGWLVFGVEEQQERVGAASVPVRRGNLLDTSVWDQEYDVIAFMPGRLLEGVPEEKAEEVRNALRTRSKFVLVYAYGDWLQKYGGLDALVDKAGLRVTSVRRGVGPGVEAALVQFQSEGGEQEDEQATANIGHGSE